MNIVVKLLIGGKIALDVTCLNIATIETQWRSTRKIPMASFCWNYHIAVNKVWVTSLLTEVLKKKDFLETVSVMPSAVVA